MSAVYRLICGGVGEESSFRKKTVGNTVWAKHRTRLVTESVQSSVRFMNDTRFGYNETSLLCNNDRWSLPSNEKSVTDVSNSVNMTARNINLGCQVILARIGSTLVISGCNTTNHARYAYLWSVFGRTCAIYMVVWPPLYNRSGGNGRTLWLHFRVESTKWARRLVSYSTLPLKTRLYPNRYRGIKLDWFLAKKCYVTVGNIGTFW